MKVVLLAGGLGSRLAEQTVNIPKPMVPIGDRPVLWHIMKIFSHFGLNDFVVCLGYKGDIIRDYYINYFRNNCDVTVNTKDGNIALHNSCTDTWKITLAETGASTMTGGRVFKIRKYLDDGPFMLTYGDGVANVRIDKLLDFHKSHDKLATMTTYRAVERFGLVNVSDESRITSMEEKGKSKEFINIGYFVMDPGVFDYFSGRDDEVLETEAISRLVQADQLMGFEHTGFWKPMDTLKDNKDLNKLWEKGDAPWKVWR